MKHKGETETKGGFYWKRGQWEIVTVDGKSGMLPGPKDAEYIRVPGLLVIPVALIVSIAYVIFLPVIGFAMLFHALVGKVAGQLRKPARAVVEAVEKEVESAKPAPTEGSVELGDLFEGRTTETDKWAA